MKRLKKADYEGKLVFVEWVDCFSVDQWIPVEEAIQGHMPVIQTVGHFMACDADKLVICATRGMHDPTGTELCAGTWTIPMGCVLSIKVIR